MFLIEFSTATFPMNAEDSYFLELNMMAVLKLIYTIDICLCFKF